MKKLWRGLNYVFFFGVLIVAILVAVFTFMSMDGQGIKDSFLPLSALVGVILFSWCRITMVSRLHFLNFRKVPVIKPKNFLMLFIIFNVVWSISCRGMFNAVAQIEEGEGIVIVIAKILLLVMGIMCLWIVASNLPFIGFTCYVKSFWNFAKGYLGVFVIYQVVFAVLSFLCNGIVLLAGQEQEGFRLAVSGFIVFSSNPDSVGMAGIATEGVSALSGLTAASTYFVLSSIAFEALKSKSVPTFKAQLKRMFFDSDTIRLFIMTVICLFVSAVSSNASNGKFIIVIVISLLAGIVALVSFVREKFIMYLLNFTIMTLIEAALPFPALIGFTSVFGVLGMAALRILLFSFVALHIGYMYYSMELMDESSATWVDRVTKASFNATILGVGLAAAAIAVDPMAAAKSGVETIVERCRDNNQRQ